jgi:hypothetical protein
MNDPDRVILPGPDRQGAQDRRYDVRIARRIEDLEQLVKALELRVQDLEP